ncbi:hypothetical protein STCU_02645 [Strigomonas culicis]|nr:hypothetical protein STCU_02645 [Strigomonas culicis]|eukprot:EPY32792.1 hypothetical protein STCU_02645 [Strigomonas culicis]
MLQLASSRPEVRQLQEQLKHAYVKKERAEQVSDKNAVKEQEAREDQEYRAYLTQKEKDEEEAEERKHAEEVERFRLHQIAQLELIRAHREAALRETEERKKERIAVDAVVARVQEQDFLNALAKRERQRQMQEDQDEFMRIRAALKQAETNREAKEEIAIATYLNEQARRRELDSKMCRERDAAKTRILEEQSRRIAEEKRKKEELEALLQEYYEEERMAKEEALARAEKESRARMMVAMKLENKNLVELRQAAKEAEQAEEVRYRQKILEQMAEDAKLEQLTKQRQQQLRKEHLIEVQKRLDDRRKQKEEEERLAKMVDEKDRLREEEILEYIRRARAQLLEEHMSKLGAYAPLRALNAEEKARYAPQIQARH